MAAKRYTVVSYSSDDTYVVHKPGCNRIAEDMKRATAVKALHKLDLDATDEEVLEELDADIEATMDDVDLCTCTGYDNEPTVNGQFAHGPSFAPPEPSSAAARASQAAATAKLLQQVEETIDKLVIKRGVDDIGEGDKWSELRLETCTDDYVYDLAVEVRKLRERGEVWWRVAYELGLPGSGASNKQGRKGSAFARRVWRAAWGTTYLGNRGQRESKITREARALADQARPYFSEDDTEMDIINRVCGQLIHWVAKLPGIHGLITSAQEAYVHHEPHLIKMKLGPQGRYLEFYEQVDSAQLQVDPRLSIAKSGPLRAVYVDRITRVGV